MKIIVVVVFYFLHWGVCFLGTGTDKKNLMGLRSYPDAVQDRVRSDPQLGKDVQHRRFVYQLSLAQLLDALLNNTHCCSIILCVCVCVCECVYVCSLFFIFPFSLFFFQ